MKILIVLILLYLQLFSHERIIAMSPAISEILFALGYDKEVVGVSQFATYPKEVKNLAQIGGYFNPNIEQIITLKPTLVIAQTHNHAFLEKLETLHIKTLEVALDTIEHIEQSIHTINTTLHNHPEEKKLLNDITQAKVDAKSSTNMPRVLLMFGLKERIDTGTYVADEALFYNDILKICHAKNAYTHTLNTQAQLFYEHIIVAAPDIIIIFHYPLTDGVINIEKAKKMYASIPTPASQKNNIFILEQDYLGIPSHRVAQTITTLCDTISQAHD